MKKNIKFQQDKISKKMTAELDSATSKVLLKDKNMKDNSAGRMNWMQEAGKCAEMLLNSQTPEEWEDEEQREKERKSKFMERFYAELSGLSPISSVRIQTICKILKQLAETMATSLNWKDSFEDFCDMYELLMDTVMKYQEKNPEVVFCFHFPEEEPSETEALNELVPCLDGILSCFPDDTEEKRSRIMTLHENLFWIYRVLLSCYHPE